MNQQYHVVFTKGKKEVVRRPWKGPSVELYSSAGKWDDDGNMTYPAMFGEHEVRQFLEGLGPFIVVSVDQDLSEKVKDLVDNGYVVDDPTTHQKSQWYVAGYFVRDEGTTLIMLPEETTDAQFLGHLGLHVNLLGKKNNCFKVGKYMKRLYSHHNQIIRGTVISKDMDKPVILVKLDNGKTIVVKYADHGKLTDGMNLVSMHCMKMLGLKGTPGDGLRITALSPKGFSKGHAIVLGDLKFDLVLFNSKKLLTGDRFVLAVDWLHAGKLRTDVQSVTNFQMYRNPCLKRWSEEFMNDVLTALPDQDKTKQMLGFWKPEFHVNKVDGPGGLKGEYIDKEKDWALLRALRAGLDYRPHPALVRKIYRLFTQQIMDCDSDIRIPVPPAAGGAKYAMVDPMIFDANGEPTLDGQLSGNTVYADAFNGDVAFHRQPNGHRSEHCIAKAVPNGILEKMDSGCFIFLSKDTVAQSLDTLGGGDQDDRLVYYTDQEVVDHFKQLERYPGEKPAAPPEAIDGINPFGHHLWPARYDRVALFTMLDMQKKQQVHIGQAVNPLIHDVVLSDNLDWCIDWTSNPLNEIQDDPKVKSAIAWMKQYKKYRMAPLAWDLEVVIDAVKKDGSDVGRYAQMVKDANADMQVVARFNIRGGKFEGRVPHSRRNSTHPVTIDTPVDMVLDEIEELRIRCEDTACEMSWQMLQPIPMEVLTCPTFPESTELAIDIRRFWGSLWAQANIGDEVETRDQKETKKRIDRYVAIDEQVYRKYCKNPLVVDAFVELYKMIYGESMRFGAPIGKNGRPEAFRDGLLWAPRLSTFTIKALEMSGIAGRYMHLDDTNWLTKQDKREFRHISVDVSIQNNVVRIAGTDRQIALADTYDTETKLEHGMLYRPAKQAYPYDGRKEQKLGILTVVNGNAERGITGEQLLAWHSHVHEHVVLVPTTYEGQHAVKVMLDDNTQHGWLTKEENREVTIAKEGWLLPGNKHTMRVVLVDDNDNNKE